MLSGSPTTEIAFFAVIKIIPKSNYWMKQGWGEFTSPYRVQSMRGSGGTSSRQSLGAGAKTEATEEWMGLTGLLYGLLSLLLHTTQKHLPSGGTIHVCLGFPTASIINRDNASEACPEAESVQPFLNCSSLFLDNPRLSRVAYTGSDWFTVVWFLLECCSSEENNPEKTAQTTSRSLRKM